jgi:hypothetical protein
MSVRRNSLLLLLGLSLPVAALTGCSSDKAETADNGTSSVTLDLISSPPKTVFVDNGESGPSIGDVDAFSATVTRDGEAFGSLFGTKTLVALPGEHNVPDGLGLFQNQLTFVLSDGTITVTGVQYFPLDTNNAVAVETVKNLATTRSVVGGTGAYAGASGVLQTSIDQAGGRVQHFEFTVQLSDSDGNG